MKFNSILLVALLLASITCIRKLNKNSKESPFEKTLRITREANEKTESFGHGLFDKYENKQALGIPVADFNANLKAIIGDVKFSENPLTYDFDLNKNGFIDREEAGLALRNVFISIARDVAFKGAKYSAPEGKHSKNVNSLVEYIAGRYSEVKKVVDGLFDQADNNKNGLLSTGKFLETFSFKSSPNLQNIINTVNPTGEEKINKDQAFYLFALLVLDSQVHEEGSDIRVAGAENGQGKHFLQKKHD
jgi:hypothetical protein